MDDKNYKRLMRWFTVMWFVVLALLLLVLVRLQKSTSAELKEYVNQQVSESRERIIDDLPEPLPGKDGKDGNDGQDGVTTIIEQQTTHVVTQPGQPGPQGPAGSAGEKGEPGERGRELQIQLNPETRDIETKYEGDDFWQVFIPCVELLVGCKE